MKGRYDGEAIVAAGGSAYFDLVAEVLAPLHDPPHTRVVVRAGAYLAHDDGFYRGISPLTRDGGEALRAALHGWVRVISRPEPDLVLFDPATVAASATFEDPRRPAVGIPYVFVDGVPVIDDGRRTDAVPGRALRRGHAA